MIACFHTEITSEWTDEELRQKAALIPDAIIKAILAKRNHLDIQLSVSGYLLLLKLIKYFKADVTLHDIIFNTYKRPGFNKDLDFNISHSGNRVICCATNEGKVGIDIEQVKPITINLDDYFNPAEQQYIRAAQNPESELINYWTRKEAVLKAIGTGVFTPLLDIDVSTDTVISTNEICYLYTVGIDLAYKCNIAATVVQETITKHCRL
ncbi:MAG: 4'-phosphopantetheinyl transferase superfamily protein [Bacteroidota bacterium]